MNRLELFGFRKICEEIIASNHTRQRDSAISWRGSSSSRHLGFLKLVVNPIGARLISRRFSSKKIESRRKILKQLDALNWITTVRLIEKTVDR